MSILLLIATVLFVNSYIEISLITYYLFFKDFNNYARNIVNGSVTNTSRLIFGRAHAGVIVFLHKYRIS